VSYSGQGINNADRNGDLHYIARLALGRFEFDNGQILEVGASYYSGRYVPTTAATFTPGGAAVTPTVVGGGGVKDTRTAINAILYPQPFGLEAEWTWGEGPAAQRRPAQYQQRVSERGLRAGRVPSRLPQPGGTASVCPLAAL
jgi:hypothetical protein